MITHLAFEGPKYQVSLGLGALPFFVKYQPAPRPTITVVQSVKTLNLRLRMLVPQIDRTDDGRAEALQSGLEVVNGPFRLGVLFQPLI